MDRFFHGFVSIDFNESTSCFKARIIDDACSGVDWDEGPNLEDGFNMCWTWLLLKGIFEDSTKTKPLICFYTSKTIGAPIKTK